MSSTGPAALAACTVTLALAAAASADPAVTADLVSADGRVAIFTLDREALAAAEAGIEIRDVALDGGTTVNLVLERFKVTGPATRFVRGPGAVEIPFDPDSIVLLRGRVEGKAGSHVFLAVSDHGSAGRIELGPGGEIHRVTDRSGGGIELEQGQFAAWKSAPGIGPLLGVPVCGLDVEAAPAPPAAAGTGPSPGPRRNQLAVDTDYEYFTLFGNEAAAAAYIVELYGAVSDIYLRDVNANVELSFVRLWDTDTDPYNDPDPLGQFVDHWIWNMGGVERDIAQLLTGRRNLPYGGVAYLSALCSDFGYSVAGYILGSIGDLDNPDTGNWDVIVTAHEAGHNAGTLHTHDEGIDTCAFGDVQRGTIMSYCHTTPGGNANIDLRFHGDIQPFMEDHIGKSACVIIDCNGNGADDASDIQLGGSADANGNGVPDECEDCNGNQVLDPTDIAMGTSDDDNGDGIPDDCQPDCNGNGQPDDLDIALGVSDDDYRDGVPDECQADCNGNDTADYNEIQADMSLDIDRNAVLDLCQDCDGDGTTDAAELAGANNLWVAGFDDDVISQIHGRSGVLVTTGSAGVLQDPLDVAVRSDGHVLVASSADDRVAEFDADGTFVGDLVAAGAGGLNNPTALALTDSGTLLVASNDSGWVLEYDAWTGASLGMFTSSALVDPIGLAWGPNGNLFVSTEGNAVFEFDGVSGANIGMFVSPGAGGLSGARGLVFKPDGNLVVASFFTDELLEYDGESGAPLGQWDFGGNNDGFWALIGPWHLKLGPDGNVYATSTAGNAAVHLYESATGSFMRSFYVLAAAGPITTPSGLAFISGDGLDCNRNFVPDACDIDSGASLDNDGNGVPDECEQVPGDANGDGAVGIEDFLLVLGNWGDCPEPCPPSCPADLDGDCAVGILDFLTVLANWTG